MSSQNPKSVELHLNDLQTFDNKNYFIVEVLRQKIFTTFPNATEIVKYNGLIYNNFQGFGGIFTYKSHVSMEFSNGYLMEDNFGFLEGSGKFRRHLKFQSIEDIATKNFQYYLDQIAGLN